MLYNNQSSWIQYKKEVPIFVKMHVTTVIIQDYDYNAIQLFMFY